MPRYQITAVGVYEFFLVLNNMMGNTESGVEFGPFPTREDLMNFYNGEKVESYEDEGPNMFAPPATKKYRKNFRKDGPLEWMNPLDSAEFETPGYFGHGVHEVLVRVEHVNKQFKLD